MGWKEKGIEDARKGNSYEEPQKDLLDRVGLGYSDNEVKQNQQDYDKGYDIGTSQRVADSNEEKSNK